MVDSHGAQMGDPIHGAQMGDPVHGAQMGAPPLSQEQPTIADLIAKIESIEDYSEGFLTPTIRDIIALLGLIGYGLDALCFVLDNLLGIHIEK